MALSQRISSLTLDRCPNFAESLAAGVELQAQRCAVYNWRWWMHRHPRNSMLAAAAAAAAGWTTLTGTTMPLLQAARMRTTTGSMPRVGAVATIHFALWCSCAACDAGQLMAGWLQ